MKNLDKNIGGSTDPGRTVEAEVHFLELMQGKRYHWPLVKDALRIRLAGRASGDGVEILVTSVAGVEKTFSVRDVASGKVQFLNEGQNIILGRDSDLFKDNKGENIKHISGKHLNLGIEKGECSLQDLNSTNGTFVEEEVDGYYD